MKKSETLILLFLFVMSFMAMFCTVHYAATDCPEVYRFVALVSIMLDLIVMFSSAIILVTKLK